ncbi:hypothetical protein [Micromonospora sp. NPDC048830]|uniref:hypothetical protein n=1 Tax=Micromonospora sp. NPDC048830 TaxID=3364257 RepID=UPI00371975DA
MAPLLPAGPDCLTVVTSRSRLSGLVAREGGHRLRLPALGEREAVALLAAMLGAPRAQREPAALARVAGHCGGLPMALRVAAVGLADRPEQHASAYADLLDAAGPLDGLDPHGDPTIDLRAAFDASYHALDEPARALLPTVAAAGLAFTARTVAARAGLPAPEARRRLHALAAVHLIDPTGSDGYRMNPLVHAWARERARESPHRRVPRPRPPAGRPAPTSNGCPTAACA